MSRDHVENSIHPSLAHFLLGCPLFPLLTRMFSLVPLRLCSAENQNLGDTVKQPFELIRASERRELKKEVKASEEEPQGVAASWMALQTSKFILRSLPMVPNLKLVELMQAQDQEKLQKAIAESLGLWRKQEVAAISPPDWNNLPEPSHVTLDDSINHYIGMTELPKEKKSSLCARVIPWAFRCLAVAKSPDICFYLGITIGQLFQHVRESNRYLYPVPASVRQTADLQTPSASSSPSSPAPKPSQTLHTSDEFVPLNKSTPLNADCLVHWMNLLVESHLVSFLHDDYNEDDERDVSNPYNIPLPAQPPHLAVFAWVCWVYSDYYRDKAQIPFSVLVWFMKCLKPNNVRRFYDITHNNYPAIVAVLDVLRQAFLLQGELHQSGEEEAKSPSQRLNPIDCLATLSQFINFDQPNNTDLRPPARVIRSALGALEAGFLKRSDKFEDSPRLRVFKHCLHILDIFSIDLAREDMNVKVCTAALRCVTRLSHSEKEEFCKKRAQFAQKSFPLIARCLIPLDFRFLHCNLASSALSTITIFTTGPVNAGRSKELFTSLYENGLLLSIRAHVLLSSYYRKWILYPTMEHVQTFLEYDAIHANKYTESARYCLSSNISRAQLLGKIASDVNASKSSNRTSRNLLDICS